MNLLLKQHGIRLAPGTAYTAEASQLTGGVTIRRKAYGEVAIIAYLGFTAAQQVAYAINRHFGAL